MNCPSQHKTLSKFCIVRSSQLDEAREQVSHVYWDHRLELNSLREKFDLHIHHVPLNSLALVYVSYRADVTIATGPSEIFFALQLFLQGGADYRIGRTPVECTQKIGSIISPNEDLTIRCMPGMKALGIPIKRQALEAHLQNLLGRSVSKPLEFQKLVDTRRKPLAHLVRFLGFYVDELERNPAFLDSPLAVTNFEEFVMTQLLLTQPNNYSNWVCRFQQSAAPYQVRVVEEYLDAHPEEEIGLQTLVSLTGHSASSIYKAFNRYRGYTPFEFLKNQRLNGLRKCLQDATKPPETVTSLAHAWGFTHLGRLSVDFKRKFGESPSETFRQKKG